MKLVFVSAERPLPPEELDIGAKLAACLSVQTMGITEVLDAWDKKGYAVNVIPFSEVKYVAAIG